MELIGLSPIFAACSGQEFTSDVLNQLGAGVDFLFALLNSDGQAPAVGDDDEGRVVCNPAVDEPFYVASVAVAVGSLTGSAEGSVWRPGYLREALFAAFAAPVVSIRRPASVRHFPDGGYSIAKRSIKTCSAHLLFDHGPLGFAPLAAHGHSDALALWLSLDDRPVFIDAGTWLYHSGEAWRDRLRSSSVHNTLTLAGASQSVPSSAFSWANKARAGWIGDAPGVAEDGEIRFCRRARRLQVTFRPGPQAPPVDFGRQHRRRRQADRFG